MSQSRFIILSIAIASALFNVFLGYQLNLRDEQYASLLEQSKRDSKAAAAASECVAKASEEPPIERGPATQVVEARNNSSQADSATVSSPEDAETAEERTLRLQLRKNSRDLLLTKIQSMVALSESETERLKERLAKEPLSPFTAGSSEKEAELLKEVLGPEKFDEYQAKSDEMFKQIWDDEIDEESYTLNKKLGLSQEQDRFVSDLIRQSHDNFSTPYKDLAKDQSDHKTQLTEILRKEQQRQSFLTERLRAVLNDEQYNKFMEFQANSHRNRMGATYLASEEQKSK